MANQMAFPHTDFSDVLASNAQFVNGFQHSELTGTARKGLAIVTCMDSRISPLAVVGMQAGDAKILRNAGVANSCARFLPARREPCVGYAPYRLPNGKRR
jgi:hypothetical protein